MNKNDFQEYIAAFLKQNAKLNLISKNDEKFLWEKHIFDSLAISNFFEKYGVGKTLLDIGTGGGFPAVPIALRYPQIEVFALDSIRKKINAISEIKQELNITNLTTICDRVENLKISNINRYDVITSRAVAPLKVIVEYAMPLVKEYFVAYKSVRAQEEIQDAQKVLKKYNAKVVDVIEYDLPLEENHTRNLIIVRK
jgi:16S rRNA (guanine527-N7)-methyltransferase